MIFSAADPLNGREPWPSDGTGGGTTLLDDLSSGLDASMPQAIREVRPGGLALFLATDGLSGLEPWFTDGTAGGTSMLFDVAPGAPSGGRASAAFTVIDDIV
ncbi:MAG: hyalin, partial [Actinobacteria bacterium]|nr:hyalin [Actinomycetota bacterium]NIV58967.1 hyalin [Actinomycetota bacterium]NIV90543.1 hyalin [Actinomycetota bacterium]NIX53742.1 hyalin [Actinomycetota bacterium]